MNQTHIHLLITHLPIFGSILGGIVLTYGLLTKSNETKVAAYILFVISAVGAGIAYLTGKSAEETIEDLLPGVFESVIKQHGESALISLVALIVLGVAALIGILTIKKLNWSKNLGTITLLISLVSFGLIFYTGYLGGLIRHTEISTGTSSLSKKWWKMKKMTTTKQKNFVSHKMYFYFFHNLKKKWL